VGPSSTRKRSRPSDGGVGPEHRLLELGDRRRLLPRRRSGELDDLDGRVEQRVTHVGMSSLLLLGVRRMVGKAVSELVVGQMSLCVHGSLVLKAGKNGRLTTGMIDDEFAEDEPLGTRCPTVFTFGALWSRWSRRSRLAVANRDGLRLDWRALRQCRSGKIPTGCGRSQSCRQHYLGPTITHQPLRTSVAIREAA